MKKLLFLLLLVGLNSCFKVPDQLVMPSWDTDLNLPITNRTYQLNDIINKSSYIKEDTINGKIVYSITSDTLHDSFGIGDYFKGKLDQTFNNLEFVIQNKEGTISVPLADSVELDSAYITSGNLSIDIINEGNSLIEFEITFPAIVKPDNQVFKVRSSVPANGKASSILDLSGCTYSSSAQNDKSKLVINGKVISGGINIVKLNVGISNSNFTYISGRLPTRNLTPLDNYLTLPVSSSIVQFRDKISISNPVLTIKSQYITKLNEPFNVLFNNIQVTGIRNDGTAKGLEDKNGNRNLGEILISKGVYTKTFTNVNSNIADLLAFLPDSLKLYADVIVNPDNKYGEASSSDTVEAKLSFSISGALSFRDISYTDSVSLEFNNDNRKAIRNGRSADLYLEITNAVPLSVDFTIDFVDSLGLSMFSKKLSLVAADVDANGQVTQPSENFSVMHLDSNEIQMLARAEIIRYNMLLNTSGSGKKVEIQPNNWLKLVTYCKLKYYIKFD
jgi:hypothetical protein